MFELHVFSKYHANIFMNCMFKSFSLYIEHNTEIITAGFFMRLLKDRKMLKKDFLRALGQGDEVIDRAEWIARDIVDRARSQADAVRQAARREGFESGRADAAGIMLSAGRERDALLKTFEDDVIDLAVTAASMIVEKARELDPASVGEAYRRALALARPGGPIRIRVAPADYEAALALAGEEGSRAWSLSVMRDEAVSAGGCIVESDGGVIDARIETQIEAVRRALHQGAGMAEKVKGI
jgi:type III secretion protein L